MAEEQIDESLVALTSHFAQVQFRLKQIVACPIEEREKLLSDLEEFAFKGCPYPLAYDTLTDGDSKPQSGMGLLSSLHHQLHSPTSYDKQTIIVDELKKKFDKQFGNIDELSEEEIRLKVNEITTQKSPHHQGTMINKLVSQVHTMEQYIQQLQQELCTLTTQVSYDSGDHSNGSYSNGSHSNGGPSDVHYKIQWCQDNSDLVSLHQAPSLESLAVEMPSKKLRYEEKKQRDTLLSLRRTLAIMHFITLGQCGGSGYCLANQLDDKPCHKSHAALKSLEICVDKLLVVTTAISQAGTNVAMYANLESELYELVSMVLSDALQELIEQGYEGSTHTSYFSCAPFHATKYVEKYKGDCPAWALMLHYYKIKNGPQICSQSSHKLSSSFNLPYDTTGPARKTLLSVIYRTEKSFQNCYNYASDIKFRSFVCEGFNTRQLGTWIKLVVNHPSLIDELYHPSAFVHNIGFRTVLQCLDRLNSIAETSIKVALPPSHYHHINSH